MSLIRVGFGPLALILIVCYREYAPISSGVALMNCAAASYPLSYFPVAACATLYDAPSWTFDPLKYDEMLFFISSCQILHIRFH